MCKCKTHPRSDKSDLYNNFCKEDIKLSGQTSSKIENEMYHALENVFNVAATWEYTTVKDHETGIQVDIGAYTTVMSSFTWIQPSKPQMVKSDILRFLTVFN